MFFDDRLATVLRQRATGEAGLRTQYRQLLDLLGKDRSRRGDRPDHSLIAAAWLRMDALAEAIPADVRARMIREPGWRFRSADLAAHLCDHEPEVAAAALIRAELSSGDWTAPIPLVSATAPLRERDRDDTGRTEISALVERIAQFRRERGENRQDFDRSPRLPLGELPERPVHPIVSFGFAADASGRIEWASNDVAPMVIGTRLCTPLRLGDMNAGDAGLERAFARRQPITRGEISLAGALAIAGDWMVDAEPRFTDEGHFFGYFGRFRRIPRTAGVQSVPEAREADRIRQLLHELRTPVTAVQGYAEVIQQQLFGPAPHEYRALAAAIAADAARILAGFEELDRLARLETGAIAIEPGETDLAALVRRTAAQIAPVLEPRGAGLVIQFPATATVLIAIDLEDAEALVWRLLASLAAACADGEQITVRLDPLISAQGAMARLTCGLPVRLAAEDNLFAAVARPVDTTINAGLFGAGFALRLARAEARAAGGGMVRDGDGAVLTLPLLTETPGVPSALTSDVSTTGT